MPYKKNLLIAVIVIFILIILLIAVLRIDFKGQGEDSWIKDSKGIYIKHGFPSETPGFVLQQQKLIQQAKQSCEQEKSKRELNSQCLGSISDYAIDIVHVPRNDEDNKIENQCEAYRNKTVSHFLELDKECEIVRIV